MKSQRRPRRTAAHRSEQVELTLGNPASGGTCVAHADAGQDRATYFVQGGLPGERVLVRTTGSTRGGKVRFATVLEVLTASPDRVQPPCPVADRCGGCDFQHVTLPAQRHWKSAVLREQLSRLGGIETVDDSPLDAAVQVEAVSLGSSATGDGEESIWRGWRTRMAVDADEHGNLGFHAHRSSQVVSVDACPVVSPQLQPIFASHGQPGQRLHACAADVPTMWPDGPASADVPTGWRERAWVTREAIGRTWRVATDGFWQAHVSAPVLLAAEVQRAAGLQSGERALDLYSGVGLFAAALATSTTPAAEVVAVEGDTQALRWARRNLHDLPSIRVVASDVRNYPFDSHVDVTVLDPPRSGAGAEVIDAVASVSARAIVHVGCDGANTARDLGRLVAAGWRLQSLRALDLFPMTHHLETVALLEKS